MSFFCRIIYRYFPPIETDWPLTWECAISTVPAKSRSNSRAGARPLSDLVGKAMTPVCRKRGFASIDILAAWPDIVGDRYGERVQPERLIWPRQHNADNLDTGATSSGALLVVHTDGATALLLSHELPQIIERINTFYGWAAVSRIKILQQPVQIRPKTVKPQLRALTKSEEANLEDRLKGVEHGGLREALNKLGAQVIARRSSQS